MSMSNNISHATLTLHFDGSAVPNPGQGGWGAVLSLSYPSLAVATKRTYSAQLGCITSNAAEYHGLIGGLRAAVRLVQDHGLRFAYVTVTVCGDSQLVINQMKGTYAVESNMLTLLNHVAKGVANRFRKVKWVHVERKENAEADGLARSAVRNMRADRSTYAVYYPSLCQLVDVWVEGKKTVGSQDCFTSGSDPSLFVDAKFVEGLPGGKQMLRNLDDPYPLSYVVGAVDMAVLGVLRLNIGVAWQRPDGEAAERPVTEGDLEVVVVDEFPVPVHVSVRDGRLCWDGIHIPGQVDKAFKARNFPSRYRQHPYWKPNSEFIFYGLEYYKRPVP